MDLIQIILRDILFNLKQGLGNIKEFILEFKVGGTLVT